MKKIAFALIVFSLLMAGSAQAQWEGNYKGYLVLAGGSPGEFINAIAPTMPINLRVWRRGNYWQGSSKNIPLLFRKTRSSGEISSIRRGRTYLSMFNQNCNFYEDISLQKKGVKMLVSYFADIDCSGNLYNYLYLAYFSKRR